jgi:hypothetical protein
MMHCHSNFGVADKNPYVDGHLAKDPVRVIAAFVGAPGIFVTDPGADDYLGRQSLGAVCVRSSLRPI